MAVVSSNYPLLGSFNACTIWTEVESPWLKCNSPKIEAHFQTHKTLFTQPSPTKITEYIKITRAVAIMCWRIQLSLNEISSIRWNGHNPCIAPIVNNGWRLEIIAFWMGVVSILPPYSSWPHHCMPSKCTVGFLSPKSDFYCNNSALNHSLQWSSLLLPSHDTISSAIKPTVKRVLVVEHFNMYGPVLNNPFYQWIQCGPMHWAHDLWTMPNCMLTRVQSILLPKAYVKTLA